MSIGVFVVYIDTGSPVLYIPSKSRDLADENKKKIDGMEMIRNYVSPLNEGRHIVLV
jgi:hypothetical protein